MCICCVSLLLLQPREYLRLAVSTEKRLYVVRGIEPGLLRGVGETGSHAPIEGFFGRGTCRKQVLVDSAVQCSLNNETSRTRYNYRRWVCHDRFVLAGPHHQQQRQTD